MERKGLFMKASEIILEEFKAVSLIYEDVIENCDKIENQVLDIFASFKRLAQAYKDALFMEGEIERKEEAEKKVVCEHEPEEGVKVGMGDSYVCTKCAKAVTRMDLRPARLLGVNPLSPYDRFDQ